MVTRRRTGGDLTAAARIRNAAVRVFAERGFGAASIRMVAAAARVSPGLIQHHFGTKAGLRREVDSFVVNAIAAAVPPVPGTGAPARVAEQIGRLITELLRNNPELFAYIRRSLLEGDAAGLALFDGVVDLTRARLQQLSDDGALRPGVDLDWAAMQIVLIDAGALMLETAVNRHLDAPLMSDAGLERWSASVTALLTQGLFRERGKRGRGTKRPRRVKR